MKRNQIQNIRVHFVPSPDGRTVAQRINEYHIQIIERRLNDLSLSPKEKLEVISQIQSKIQV